MNGIDAVITAEGEFAMMTSTTEQQAAHDTSGTTQEPKMTTKANAALRKPRVAPAKAKSPKQTAAKKAAKAPKKAAVAKIEGVRDGSKTAKVMDLLKRPHGATMKELMKATGWQPHSVRGFLSGTLGRKMRVSVTSVKSEDGERTYSVKG